MKETLNEFTDIVKIYNPDYTIVSVNDIGYNIYKKNLEKVVEKKYYQLLFKEEKCNGCLLEKTLKNKQTVEIEKYIPEINKYINLCYNPVLNEDGEVIYIVERLRDITDKKILKNILKESEERYNQVVNNSPDAVIVIEDNKIVLANTEACKLIGLNCSKIIGESIYKFVPSKYIKTIHKRSRRIVLNKETKVTYDYEFNCSGAKSKYLQISSSYIMYKGKQAILSVMRDITEMKKESIKAGELMRKTLQKLFPIPEKVNMEIAYTPANIVSGDSFRMYKANNDLVIGMIIDVSGKGITAALGISAIEVLFYEEVSVNHDPVQIVKNLNKKLINYLEENYIAVCCYSMDFSKKELEVVGAGINEFIFKKQNGKAQEIIVEGAFLGMFENSIFDEKIIHFESGDRFYFFTDGLDFILDDDKIIQSYMEKVSIREFKNYIEEFLSDTLMEVGNLKDDCTLVALEIR